jgi:hypothetical protein
MSEDKEKMAEDCIQILTGRINKNSDKIKGWGKAIRIGFMDLDMGYWIKLSMDGTVEKVEKGPWKKINAKEAVTSLITTVEVLSGSLDGSIDSRSAAVSGQIKVEGSYDGLIKLSPALMG